MHELEIKYRLNLLELGIILNALEQIESEYSESELIPFIHYLRSIANDK